MADTAVSFLLENLKESISQNEDCLTGVEDKVRWIEDQFEKIVARFEKIEALPQPPEDFDQWMEDFKIVIHRAEDLIQTYAKRVSESSMAGISRKLIYWIELCGLGKELKRIRDEIAYVRDRLAELDGPEWSFVKDLPESEDVTPGSDASNILVTSVPPYLRQCIYYFLLFPANFEVPTRRLIVLWVAEGLVRSNNNNNESAEQVAERYLNDLIDLGVVLVKKKRLNGKVKACKLEDGTRDTWLMKAKEAKFLQDRPGDIRRLVDHNGTRGGSFIQIHGNPSISHSVPNYRDVLSFLSFDTQERSKPGEDIGDFLHKCILAGCFLWLRVLDLELVFRPKLPKSLGKLIRLKYLGLRWTCLERLPKFVNKLLNLQVLDVKHSYISVLPKSIWSMQYLRHLYLSEIYRTRFVGRPSGITLTALQTLWGAFIDEDTCVTDGLDTLRNIRKLGLSWRSKPSSMKEQLEAVDQWISKLEFLESLRLKSRDEHGHASDLHLSSLQGKEKLSTVYLLGKLDPLVVREFPANLTDITLSESKLNVDPMEFLGSLPKLQILQLLARSVVLDTMHCSRTGFPVLKVLYIWKLEDLEKWEAEEGSLPSLKKLEIRSCEKLKTLPDGLQHVKTLEEFQLTSMPEGFTDVIKENQSQLWAKIERVLKIK